MIRLVNDDLEIDLEVAIPRDKAVLIRQALAPGWRFVEEVEIGTAPPPPAPPAAKQEAPKPAKKPRAKAEPKAPKRNTVVEDAVRSRLSAGDGSPKSFAELAGPPLKDSAVRAALEALRAAGEVVVTGQKRGTRYQLVERPTAPTTAQAAE